MKVLLVDDHEMVRLGLKSFLSMQTDIDKVLEAQNGKAGVELALKERPEVIIMDIVMPELNGIDATLAILKEWPEAKIVILTSYLDNEKIYPVLDAGAKGYMLKTSSATEILQSVRKVAKGSLRLRQKLAKRLSHERIMPPCMMISQLESEIFWLY